MDPHLLPSFLYRANAEGAENHSTFPFGSADTQARPNRRFRNTPGEALNSSVHLRSDKNLQDMHFEFPRREHENGIVRRLTSYLSDGQYP
jgi:hypothetical protein